MIPHTVKDNNMEHKYEDKKIRTNRKHDIQNVAILVRLILPFLHSEFFLSDVDYHLKTYIQIFIDFRAFSCNWCGDNYFYIEHNHKLVRVLIQNMKNYSGEI